MKEKIRGEGQSSFPFSVSIRVFAFLLLISAPPIMAQRTDGEPMTRYDQLAADAALLNKRGQFDRVISLLQPHQQDRQNKSSLFFNELGIAYRQLKKYPEAARAYQQAIERDPQNPVIHNNLGYVFYLQKDYPRALEQYQKAIDLAPRFKEAYGNLSLVYYAQNRLPEALQTIDIVLRLDPNDSAAQSFRQRILARQKEKGRPTPSP